MAKHIWTVLCKASIVDATSNAVSLIEVLEEITVKLQEPMQDRWGLLPMQAHLVVFIERSDLESPETIQLKVDTVAPGGELRPDATIGQIDLTNHKRSRTTIQLPGLPIRTYGVHKFIASLRRNEEDHWTVVSETPLEIKADDSSAQVRAVVNGAKPEKKKTRKKRPLP